MLQEKLLAIRLTMIKNFFLGEKTLAIGGNYELIKSSIINISKILPNHCIIYDDINKTITNDRGGKIKVCERNYNNRTKIKTKMIIDDN